MHFQTKYSTKIQNAISRNFPLKFSEILCLFYLHQLFQMEDIANARKSVPGEKNLTNIAQWVSMAAFVMFGAWFRVDEEAPNLLLPWLRSQFIAEGIGQVLQLWNDSQ
jgi:hypothetical protein